MLRKVSASGNWRLTARTASVAGVRPMAQVNSICLLSSFNSDLKVEVVTAINRVARSMTIIRMPIDRLAEIRAGVITKVKPRKTKNKVSKKNEFSY